MHTNFVTALCLGIHTWGPLEGVRVGCKKLNSKKLTFVVDGSGVFCDGLIFIICMSGVFATTIQFERENACRLQAAAK